MPNTDLNPRNIQQEVQSLLGGSQVAVELQDSDYVKATKDAIREYNRTVPQHGRYALPVSASQQKYPIVQPGLIGVVYVDFTGNGIQFGASTEFGPPFSNVSPTGLGIAGATFGEVDNAFSYAKQTQQIASAEPEYHQQWEGENYYLYIYVPTTLGTVNCSYEFTWAISPDNNSSTGMQLISQSDVQWVMDYIACRCKQILARMRDKFRGIPNAQGGSDQTDAANLLAEAQEEERELKRLLGGRRRALPPVTG